MRTSPVSRFKSILDEGLDSQKRVKRPVDWAFTLSFFLIILLSGSVQSYDIRVLASLNMAVQLWLLWKVKFRLSRRLTLVIQFISLYLIYSLVITGFNTELIYVFFRFYDIFAASLLLNYWLIRKPDVEKSFFYVLMFFFLHGVLGFVLSNLFYDIYTPIIVDGVYAGAQLGYLFFLPHESHLGFQRNQGMFWEPGVYQMYLNILLFYCTFIKRSIVLSVLVLCGVFSTLSTTGLFIAMVQILIFAVIQIKPSKKGIAILVMVLLSFPVLIPMTVNNIDDKLNGDRAGSSWARSFDTINGLMIVANNPFGIGFSHVKYQSLAADNPYEIETPLQTDRGQTNGIIMLFYSTGFLWGFVWLYLFLNNKIFNSKAWLLNFVVFVSLLTEPLLFSPFFFIFALAGLINRRHHCLQLDVNRHYMR